ncbi:MAG: phosphate ABC transporter substrate-binding protein PstS [Candidatus Nomurabacteria bacterium]|nr:MAG: phosphate ABC transporter substrate-binding protein PstS [Candidatus Nomurabacteria bacterium]
MSKNTGMISGVIAVIVVAAGLLVLTNNKSDTDTNKSNTAVTVTGAGSTFAAPVYGQLGKEYKDKKNVTINYQSVGSGAGVAQFIANTVNFGGTDVALKDSEVSQAKVHGDPLNIPVSFGAITVSYNLPGVKSGLKLDGSTVADIYMGKITKWNDSAITTLNPGVSLPDMAISPVYRSDSSGTTAQLTTFLADESSDWSSQIGSDKTVKWPAGTGSKGNDGVAATTSQTVGALGYVELAYALQNNFTVASVKNKMGEYVAPSLDTTSKAGDNLPNLPEDLRFTSIDSPAEGAYPIASPTFIVTYQDVCKAGAVKNANEAGALKGWLGYILGEGQVSMKKLEYAPLAPSLLKKAQAKVDSMTCNGSAIQAR